jgi:hypothetical protein
MRFVLVLAILALTAVSAPQVFASYHGASGGFVTLHYAGAASGCSVSSGGQEQEYLYTAAVSSTNHQLAFDITGARIVQDIVQGSNKVYLFVYVNTASTSQLSSSGTTSTCSTNYSRVTNNVYWDVQDGAAGRTLGTVGGDVAYDSASGLLLVNQYVDKNHYPGQNAGIHPQSSSGPACQIDTKGQERSSIYMVFVNPSTQRSYVLSGSSLVEKSVGGVTSTYLYVYLTSNPMNINWSGMSKGCSVSLSSSTYYFEWSARAPPPNNSVPGNYRIYGTTGGDLGVFGSTSAGVCDQFVDPNYQF